jgi:hypothetical protein
MKASNPRKVASNLPMSVYADNYRKQFLDGDVDFVARKMAGLYQDTLTDQAKRTLLILYASLHQTATL